MILSVMPYTVYKERYLRGRSVESSKLCNVCKCNIIKVSKTFNADSSFATKISACCLTI